MKSVAEIFFICASLICGGFAVDARADQASDQSDPVRALTKRVEELEKALAAKRSADATTAQPISTPGSSAPFTPKAPFLPSVEAPMTTGSTPFTFGSDTLSVTLYGLISAGVTSVSNINGKAYKGFLSGPQQPPRFGAKTFWDLGDGNSAIAVLEGGYSLANGTLGQGGRIFGRQAFFGAQSLKYGAVTLGRQYDEIATQLWWSESGNVFATFGDHIGDNDNIANTFRLNNSVRYQAPKFNNITLAGSYAVSNQPSNPTTNQSQNNSAVSVGGQYDGRDASKDGVRAGLAFTRLSNPNSSTNANGAVDSGYGFSSPFVTSPTAKKAAVMRQRIGVAGASYSIGPYTVTGGYSNVHFDYQDSSGLKLQNAELFGTVLITPKLLAGLGLMYTKGAYSTGTNPNWKQINIGVDYFINRYIDVFLVDNYQRAGGDATQAWIYTLSPSSSTSQNALTAGMRVKF